MKHSTSLGWKWGDMGCEWGGMGWRARWGRGIAIAGIALIADIARNRKNKTVHRKGHEGTQRKTAEGFTVHNRRCGINFLSHFFCLTSGVHLTQVHANLGWLGMKWDEPGGGRG